MKAIGEEIGDVVPFVDIECDVEGVLYGLDRAVYILIEKLIDEIDMINPAYPHEERINAKIRN